MMTGLRKCQKIFTKKLESTLSFLATQSHYTRHDNPGRLYLEPNLSIARMYQMFLAAHDQEYVAHMERKREALISHHPTC